jgi:hypothetical protein
MTELILKMEEDNVTAGFSKMSMKQCSWGTFLMTALFLRLVALKILLLLQIFTFEAI